MRERERSRLRARAKQFLAGAEHDWKRQDQQLVDQT
jgi:hypothetical protein